MLNRGHVTRQMLTAGVELSSYTLDSFPKKNHDAKLQQHLYVFQKARVNYLL